MIKVDISSRSNSGNSSNQLLNKNEFSMNSNIRKSCRSSISRKNKSGKWI